MFSSGPSPRGEGPRREHVEDSVFFKYKQYVNSYKLPFAGGLLLASVLQATDNDVHDIKNNDEINLLNIGTSAILLWLLTKVFSTNRCL